MAATAPWQKSYKNKLVVVTGGSEGIGLAAALQLALWGADVVVGSRNREHLEKALSLLEKNRASKNQILATIPVDVTNVLAVQQAMGFLIERYRTPDILINSAGSSHPGYLEDLDVAILRQMMDLNYFGIVHTVKAVLPAMRVAGKGHIVNISSMAGYLGLFGYAGYCASKYAVIGFSEALRREVRPYGIRVSVVCPPNTRTPGLERENRIKPSEVLQIEEKVKTVEPEAVARAMLRAIPKNGFIVNPTLDGKFVYLASRWVPTGVMDYFLRRPLK